MIRVSVPVTAHRFAPLALIGPILTLDGSLQTGRLARWGLKSRLECCP